ncbi:hypothetical protein [Micromonospora rubida]|uniref:hypothetical protein n=1 Tax=Micromonospora rubida TaxID=2697657 RepID=UPI001377753F|nr:hypothetical protein [Micromonospora rubida]NBE79741.1 hypothetical protein [Micromonospora rubida]
MNTVSAPGEVRFRWSRRRTLLYLAAGALVVMAVAWLTRRLLFGVAGVGLFPQLLIPLLAAVVAYVQAQKHVGLPLLLTEGQIVVTRPDGGSLTIDRDNLAVAEVRGRGRPILVLEPADPGRVRPALNRWEWSRSGLWSQSQAQRPYEIRVPLFGLAPGVGRLRAELAGRRRPATAPGAEEANPAGPPSPPVPGR